MPLATKVFLLLRPMRGNSKPQWGVPRTCPWPAVSPDGVLLSDCTISSLWRMLPCCSEVCVDLYFILEQDTGSVQACPPDHDFWEQLDVLAQKDWLYCGRKHHRSTPITMLLLNPHGQQMDRALCPHPHSHTNTHTHVNPSIEMLSVWTPMLRLLGTSACCILKHDFF